MTAWEPSQAQIRRFLARLSQGRLCGFYAGKPGTRTQLESGWKYCPYCGGSLEDEDADGTAFVSVCKGGY